MLSEIELHQNNVFSLATPISISVSFPGMGSRQFSRGRGEARQQCP